MRRKGTYDEARLAPRIKSGSKSTRNGKHQSKVIANYVLNAGTFAPLPNFSFNADVHATHGRRLTFALGRI
jgi:hypothetical protein